MIPTENVLIDQLKTKPGGQIVEITGVLADKAYSIALLELQSEQWVLVFVSEAWATFFLSNFHYKKFDLPNITFQWEWKSKSFNESESKYLHLDTV